VTLKTEKLPRWKRIAQEASKQCGRSRIPDIEIENFADIVNQTHTPLFYMDQHAKKSFRDYSQECAKMQSLGLCIGPEGGWSEAELTFLKKTGQKSIKLGPFTLRAETAAVAALAQALAFIK
jgi:16S rRNA (uracil1498-N3)-methyltransferase